MSLLDAASRIAETVLAPAAAEVDATGVVPDSHFAALADAGLYGIATSDEAASAAEVAELLVSGCRATGFVWAQHHGVLTAAAQDGRHELVAELAAGRTRAAVSYAGLALQGRTLRITPDGDGYLLNGGSAMVTGWGLTDLLGAWAHDAERGEDLMVLVPRPHRTPGIDATLLSLVAARASRTVGLRWHGVRVGRDAIIGRRPADRPPSTEAIGTRLNGALSLGTCRAALRQLDTVDDVAEQAAAGRRELDGIRAAMNAAMDDVDELYRLRGHAADLAVRLAAATVAATGSHAVLAGSDAERLTREAVFCIVCATRPGIRAAVLERTLGV
ncbi:acyl-CoA/acyl-ACP dehydrogenase [Tsukamurella sp. 8F]|uniref:acyl-CoA dehydrogenase family protein n=1 Tax=unclassified Tsukamurella TaxID=2633480 RepID=UPI0023B9E26D|nr:MULTISPECIES: acyl-CoA dehydrogenase family protein [unclassified Tsukamurella]MDF0530164.1 acyl-CoA/acyl-ACP dehydrogenase [Tsukamurella sp. 8J]MDF0586482.1 acyl-CoA/acyl-ACP dehydrogenase [Tsukamurella sp. 8F]